MAPDREEDRDGAAPAAKPPSSRAGVLSPLAELWRFLRAPQAPMPAFPTRGLALRFYAHLFLLMLALQFAWVLLAAGIKEDGGAAFRGFGLRGWALAVVLVLIVPVMEELIFRSWLKQSVFLPVLALWFAFRQLAPWLPLATALQLLALALVLLALVLRTERLRAAERRGDEVLARWLPVTVPLSTTWFAVIHVPNWDLPATSLWLVPVLVLPQFASGLMFAYARLRSGLGAAIGLHAALNAVVVLVLLAATLAEG